MPNEKSLAGRSSFTPVIVIFNIFNQIEVLIFVSVAFLLIKLSKSAWMIRPNKSLETYFSRR